MKLKQIVKGVILGAGLLAGAVGCSGDKNVRGIVIEKHLDQSSLDVPALSLLVVTDGKKQNTYGFAVMGSHHYDSLPQRM